MRTPPPAACTASRDVAFIDQDGVERRQSAPLVIELEGGRVTTIVYYPEYPIPD